MVNSVMLTSYPFNPILSFNFRWTSDLFRLFDKTVIKFSKYVKIILESGVGITISNVMRKIIFGCIVYNALHWNEEKTFLKYLDCCFHEITRKECEVNLKLKIQTLNNERPCWCNDHLIRTLMFSKKLDHCWVDWKWKKIFPLWLDRLQYLYSKICVTDIHLHQTKILI